MSLRECTSCQRHVKRTDTACPFCGEAMTPAAAPVAPLPRARLGRAALVALGASALTMGCDEPGPRAVYGGPPVEMVEAGAPKVDPSAAPTTPPTPTTSATTPPPPDTNRLAPAYGAPPVQKKP